MKLQYPISAANNQAQVGKIVAELIEHENPMTEELIGRSPRFAPEVDSLIYIQGTANLGSITSVRINSADVYDLYGEIETN